MFKLVYYFKTCCCSCLRLYTNIFEIDKVVPNLFTDIKFTLKQDGGYLVINIVLNIIQVIHSH